MRGAARETAIAGAGAIVLAALAMAVDHLLEDEGDFPADLPTFVIACALSLLLAVVVFGWLVPSARRADRPGRTALTLAVVALVSVPLTLWLGLPFVLAAGAVLIGRGARGRAATIAVGLGVLVLVFGVVAYAYVAVDKLG